MKIPPHSPDIQGLLELERDFIPEPEERMIRVQAAVVQSLGLPPPTSGGPGEGGDQGFGGGSAPAPAPAPTDGGAAGTAAAATTGSALSSGLSSAGALKLAAVGLTIYLGGVATGAGVYHGLNADRGADDDGRFGTVVSDYPTAVSDAEVAREPIVVIEDDARPAPDADTEAMALSHTTVASRPQRESVAVGALRPDSGASSTSSEEIARERRLIEAARAAVTRGNVPIALDAINRHAEQFPSGRFIEEREAIRILALLAAGRVDAARQRANVFARRYPRSLFLRSIEQELSRRQRPPQNGAAPPSPHQDYPLTIGTPETDH